MYCNIIKEKIVDLFDEEINPEEKNKILAHLKECPACKQEYEAMEYLSSILKPKVSITASHDLKESVIRTVTQNSARKEESAGRLVFLKPYTKRLIALAATLVLALIIVPLVNRTGNSSTVAANVAQKLFDKSAMSLQNLKSLYIDFMVRTDGGDNFDYIDIKGNFVKHELWKKYTEPVKWKMEKPGRVVLMDGANQYLYIKNIKYAVKSGKQAGFVGWIRILLDPASIMETEKKIAAQNKAEYTIDEKDGQTILTVKAKALGDFKNNYLLNSSIEESNSRRVYTFDKETSRLQSMQVFVESGKNEVLVIDVKSVTYDSEIPESVFNIALPENVTWGDMEAAKPEANGEFDSLPSDKVARIFFEACATRDWAKAAKLCPEIFAPTAGSDIKKTYGGLEILSIGKPFKSGQYPGEFVPYEIKLKNGIKKKHNLAVRNDNPAKAWQVDGGL